VSITDDQIQTYLKGKLDGTHPEFGTVDSTTIYTIFYSETTTITAGSGTTMMTSCTSFGGYHSEFTLANGMNIVYAVMPRCSNFSGLNGIDMVTGAVSHEILEASTDPYVVTGPALSGTDDIGVPFEIIWGGGEVGDMCTDSQGAFYKPADLPFTVQRGWSNAAAAAGQDPCVPAMGPIYFNASVEENDSVSYGPAGQTQAVKGIKIPAGTSKTINLDLFSDADLGSDMTVSVLDYGALMNTGTTLNFALNKTTGRNGDKLQLTITPVKMDANGVAYFLVETTANGRTTYWAGMVGEN
jgi:hypothetical protein